MFFNCYLLKVLLHRLSQEGMLTYKWAFCIEEIKNWSFSLWHFWDQIWSVASYLGLPSTRKMILMYQRVQQRITRTAGGWSTWCTQSSWENFSVQWGKRWWRGNPTAVVCNYLIRGYREDRVRLFLQVRSERMDMR